MFVAAGLRANVVFCCLVLGLHYVACVVLTRECSFLFLFGVEVAVGVAH